MSLPCNNSLKSASYGDCPNMSLFGNDQHYYFTPEFWLPQILLQILANGPGNAHTYIWYIFSWFWWVLFSFSWKKTPFSKLGRQHWLEAAQSGGSRKPKARRGAASNATQLIGWSAWSRATGNTYHSQQNFMSCSHVMVRSDYQHPRQCGTPARQRLLILLASCHV